MKTALTSAATTAFLSALALIWALNTGYYVRGSQVQALANQIAFADPVAVIAGRE
jgi:hypothetical protein